MSTVLRPRRLLPALLIAALVAAGPAQEAAALSPETKTVVQLTNEDRAASGLRNLRINRKISRYATRHSEKMADRGGLFHTHNLARPLRRVHWRMAAENVGVGSSLESLQQAFMHSSVHRQNILGRKFRRVAAGVVFEDGRYWVTVIFYG